MGDPKALKSTSSSQSIPSPDGALIATLSSTCITVTDAKFPSSSTDVVRTIRLPPELSGDVTTFLWSSSSRRVLLAVADQIHVFAALADNDDNDNFHATIQHPSASPATRTVLVRFGAHDNEVCAWSAFGIKLTLFNLATSKALEISNPKFYAPASAAWRGVSFRPSPTTAGSSGSSSSSHLAVLTQTAGRDMISIHGPGARELQRAWFPDTIDAQGLEWSPDGRWLVVWESASQGHKVLFYTQDGHLFKDWRGPISPAVNSDLGPGVRLVVFSPDGQRVAIVDESCYICIINLQSMSEEARLQHPKNVEPRDAIHVSFDDGS